MFYIMARYYMGGFTKYPYYSIIPDSKGYCNYADAEDAMNDLLERNNVVDSSIYCLTYKMRN